MFMLKKLKQYMQFNNFLGWITLLLANRSTVLSNLLTLQTKKNIKYIKIINKEGIKQNYQYLRFVNK